MANPVHNRGSAAEQGAAIRRQREESEQKQRRLSQRRGDHQPSATRASNSALRSVPPPHASQEAAAQPAPRSPKRQSQSIRSSKHQEDESTGRAKRGSRSLRQQADSDEHGSSRGSGGAALAKAGSTRRGRAANRGSVQQGSAEAIHDEDGRDEVQDEKPSRRKSRKAAVATGVVGSSAAASAARRHNYASGRSDPQGPVYSNEDGEEDVSGTGQGGEEGETSTDEGEAAVVAAGGAGASRREPKLEAKGRVYPLTGIDNVALLMEDAGYQTACFSVYLFKTVLDYDTVRNFFEQLADAYPKYHYVCELDPSAAFKKDKASRKGKPYQPSGVDHGRKTRYSKSLKAGGLFRPARWRFDETFNIEENIVVRDAPGNGDDQVLFDMCGDVLSQHFDFSKPLWEATVVHGLNTSEGARSALMIKIHHAFSDGQGMIQSYHSAIEAMAQGVSVAAKQSEFDTKATQASQAKKSAAAKSSEKAEEHGEQKNVGTRNIKPTLGATIRHSWHTVRGLYFRRREEFNYSDAEAKRSVKSMGGDLSKNCRPSTRLYAHSDGIAMGDIKLIRQAFSTDKINLTLNDVASAILSRALRIAAEEMAKKSGKKVRDKRVAVFIPISKRPKGDWTLANYTTGAIAWFRFHNPSHYGFEQLLHQVHREMNRIKQSYLPQWWFYWFNAICKRRAMQLPNYPIFRQIFQAAYREYHVFTNLPGPAKPVKFGKHEAFSYHVLPPSSPGRSTMAIGTISYAQDFSLAVSCDGVASFKDKELTTIICNAFQEASLELVAAAKERLSSNKTQ
ncbi:unnamed protein product [Sympodiomycopsis kandeliae]